MKPVNTLVALLVFGGLSLAQTPPLRLEKTIPLPGVEGRIDHLAADINGRRLFVAALGNHSVEVVDIDAGKVVHHIPNLKEPQGLFYWPSKNRLYAACAGDGSVRAFDGASFQPLETYDFNEDADNLRFDTRANELFVGYADGALGVVNVELGSRVGETMLDGHPESFQLEQTGPRIFVNVPKTTVGAHVTVIDRRTRSVVAKWPLPGVKANFPMALDETNHRLFIGCRFPMTLLVLDTRDGKIRAREEIPADADDLFYDSTTRRIYVSGGAGFIGVLTQTDADHYQPAIRIPTAPGARTSLFVEKWKRLFVAVPHRGKQAAALMVFATE